MNSINIQESTTLHFNFKYLEDISKKDSNEILKILVEKQVELKELLSDVPPEFIVVTVCVLTNVCQTNFTEIIKSILSHACSCNFLRRLEDYMLKLPYERETDKKKNKLYYDDVNRFWSDLIGFLKGVIKLLPSKVCKLQSILEKINVILEAIEIFQKDYKIDEKIKDYATNLFKEFQAEMKKIEEENKDIVSHLFKEFQAEMKKIEEKDKDIASDLLKQFLAKIKKIVDKNKVCTSVTDALPDENAIDDALELDCKPVCMNSCLIKDPCQILSCHGSKHCQVKVERKLKCGHTVDMPCSTDPNTFSCYIQVEVTLPGCNHKMKKPCHLPIDICECTHPCDSRLLCGHSCTRTCHVNSDPYHIEYKCSKDCAKTYSGCENKHRCRKRCHEECGPCPVIMKKTRSCGHCYNEIQCFANVEEQPCMMPCTHKIPSCGHDCKLRCSDVCGMCQVKVKKTSVNCGHIVEVKCCEEATSFKCRSTCQKMLPCGHPCTKKCKDICTIACENMVTLNNPALCGHIFKVPCFLQKTDPKSLKLLKYCKEPCRVKLACGHLCKGNCILCEQGRIHIACSEPCGILLVCGHKCDEPCKEECKPCQRDCEMQCYHSKCKQKCGMPCTPCIERCTFGCEHKKCTKRCSELCDIEPCKEPCKKMLQCNHPCVGFCGDPCPPLCRICDKEELTTVMFGDEDAPNARYVLLEDCSHCIESNGLSLWLKRDNTNDNEPIQIKRCPKCTTPIRKCTRLMNQIKIYLKNVHLVKTELFCGKYADLNDMQSQHLKTIEDMINNSNVAVHPELEMVLKDLQYDITLVKNKKRQILCAQEIDACRVILEILRHMFDALSSINNEVKSVANNILEISWRKEDTLESYKFVRHHVAMLVESIPSRLQISKQRLEDIHLELQRLNYMAEVCNMEAENTSTNMALIDQKELNHLMTEITSLERFEKNLESKVQEKINGLRSSAKLVERQMIVGAMGYRRGNWYKCPNGHIYATGDCNWNPPNEESKCNECKAAIGGRSHRLLSGNTVATEMDEAARASPAL